jgi:uncharacterized membrane-anchored protein YitT (DUF2179 family)
MARSFTERHIGPRPEQTQEMLQFIGVNSMEELIEKTVPAEIRIKEPLSLEEGMSEQEFTTHLKTMAAKNLPFRSLIGLGYYGTASLPVVLRNVFENPSWYTSYTPYQAEISQGRLEALFNYQTMVCSLTGFNLSNSSLLDESTAAAEAMRMMLDLRSRTFVKEGRTAVLVDRNIFPQTLAVMETRALGLGIEILTEDLETNPLEIIKKHESRIFGVVVQYPGADGKVCDHSILCKEAHDRQLMVTAVCDLLSLAVLKEPAAWGADIAAGCAQRFGLPMALDNGKLVSALMGATASGVGIGMVIAQGGSTGGTDILAQIIGKYRNISPGRFMMSFDLLIIASLFFISDEPTIGLKLAAVLYGYLIIGLFGYTVDVMLSGAKRSVQYFIFSAKYQEIADRISNELNRGVTVITSQGWYTKNEQQVLLVIVRRTEANAVAKIVKEVDKNAFLSKASVSGVYGAGFEVLKA